MTKNPIYASQEQIGKALITLAAQKALFDIGKPTYDKVVQMLYTKYYCYLPDCYEHPEYLSKVLKALFGRSGDVIAESIRTQLQDFMYKKPIANFLQVICR